MHETSHLQQHFYTVSNRLPSFLYFLSQFCFILFSSSSSFGCWTGGVGTGKPQMPHTDTSLKQQAVKPAEYFPCISTIARIPQLPKTERTPADLCGFMRNTDIAPNISEKRNSEMATL